MKKQTNAEWLESQVGYTGDDCLTWPFGRCCGYGVLKWRDAITYAHRAMCILVNGEPPAPGYEAAHTCGRGHEGCVNPKHLEWKTHADNQRDRHEHGTIQRGKRGRITYPKAEEIRALKGQLSEREIADLYGVTRANVSAIHRGLTHTKPNRGVVRYKDSFYARIQINGKTVQLGVFKSEAEAAAAYHAKHAELVQSQG